MQNRGLPHRRYRPQRIYLGVKRRCGRDVAVVRVGGIEGDFRVCSGCWASEPPNSMDVVFDRFAFTHQSWSGDTISALTRSGDPPPNRDCEDDVQTLPDGTEISTGCTANPGLKWVSKLGCTERPAPDWTRQKNEKTGIMDRLTQAKFFSARCLPLGPGCTKIRR